MLQRGHTLSFFLTPAEQVALLEAFEARHLVTYYRAGTSPAPEAPAIASLVGEESLGRLANGDCNHSPRYLLSLPGEGVVVREITLRKGGYAYAVDQQLNPELAGFRPAGQFGEAVLVEGMTWTFTRTSHSGLLFQAFVKLLKQRSRRIGGSFSWVGADAEAKLRLGWRLVSNVSSPQEYDVALD